MTDDDKLVEDRKRITRELEAKLTVCEREGLTFMCSWNLIRAT